MIRTAGDLFHGTAGSRGGKRTLHGKAKLRVED